MPNWQTPTEIRVNSDDDQPLSLVQLCELAKYPYGRERNSAQSATPYLLFEAGTDRLSESDQLHVARWLRALPCPGIGIFSDAAAWAEDCDVVVTDTAVARSLIENINRCPIAATVLVQLLRITESLPLDSALTAESLAYATLQAGPEFHRWLVSNRASSPFVPSDHGPAVIMDRDGNTLKLELNRASNRNAMNVEMRDALCEALQLVLADDSIERVFLSGRGKCFSTGGDLSEFGSAPDPATAHIVRSMTLPGRLLDACAARVEVHVHGACIGSGIEFPAFAGRIVAAENAYFQLPELKYGLIPGAGGCVSIARRIGRQRTAWLALSGKRINAQMALEWGLVDAVSG